MIIEIPSLAAACVATVTARYALQYGYAVWRELPARRQEQLDYLERLSASPRWEANDEDQRR